MKGCIMKMRTVYRYENDYGQGPYRQSGWLDYETKYRMCDDHRDAGHPTWSAESGWFDDMGIEYVRPPYDYRAGCATREDLDAWFDGWHETLAENGFTVKEFTVPAEHVRDAASGLQLAFKRP